MSEQEKEFDFSNYDVNENQVCLINVPVAGLSGEHANAYLQAVAKAFKQEMDRAELGKVAFFVFPKNPDGTCPEMQVFEPADGEHYVVQIPVDGLPAKERVMYLKLLKDELEKEWPNRSCTISVVPKGANVILQGHGTLG